MKTEAASVQNIIFGYSRQCWEPPFEFSWAGQLRDQSSRSMLVKPERRLTEHGGGEEKVLWAGGDDERRHVEGGEVSHGEDEPAETFDPLRRRHLKQPTPEEVRVHQTTHLPVRERRAECWAERHTIMYTDRTRSVKKVKCLGLPEVQWSCCSPMAAELRCSL